MIQWKTIWNDYTNYAEKRDSEGKSLEWDGNGGLKSYLRRLLRASGYVVADKDWRRMSNHFDRWFLAEPFPHWGKQQKWLQAYISNIVRHVHGDECWEPDSGCDLGRNENHVVATPPRAIFANDSIKAVAIRKANLVWALPKPYRHHDVIAFLVDVLHHKAPISASKGYEQGFIGPKGKFLTREKAAKLVGKPGKLYSEDLW